MLAAPGERLRAWLARENHTQTWLAVLLNVRQSAVSNWCVGRYIPEGHHREALEIVTGIPADAWLRKDDLRAVERARAFARKRTGTDG